MPISFDRMLKGRGQARIDFGDEDVLNIEYRADLISPRMAADLRILGVQAEEAAKAEEAGREIPAGAVDAGEELVRILCTLIATWDATYPGDPALCGKMGLDPAAAGQPIAPTPETLMVLGYEVLGRLCNEILTNHSPKSGRKETPKRVAQK